jgi:undecaprenyl-diphosphatase
MLDWIIELDTQLFLYLNNLGVSQWDAFWRAVSGKFIWIPLYAVLLSGFYRYYKLKGFLIVVLFVVLNVFATDQGSVQLFKEQFMRLRPCHVEALQENMRLVKDSCGGQYGFISSHASNTFGLALFAGLALRRKLPWLIYLLVAWAAMVSYSRVYLGVHYPTDILAGGVFGAICGTLLHTILVRLFNPQLKNEL